jgi:hypothetical protein
MLVGGQEGALRVRLCGRLFLYVLCGTYGVKEMRDVLRIPQGL